MIKNTYTNNSRYKKGVLAEKIAKMYLRFKGYRILESRLRTPVGEIDILALRDGVYIVVEVKYRKNMHTALYSITDRQQQRLLRAGTWVLAHYETEKIRFDGILISPCQIKHVENAFGQA